MKQGVQKISKVKNAAFRSAFLAVCVIALSACDKSPPSEANGKAELAKGKGPNSKISYGLKNGSIQVNSFTKSNGHPVEIFGTKGYRMKYQAELIFLENIPRDKFCVEAMEGYCGGNVAGDKKIITGEIMFKQTEKGWEGGSGAVY